MTLVSSFVPQRTLATNAAIVLFGSAFVAFAAQVSVPMFPVPMTLQTLAVLLVGFAFGARMGGATLLAYLAEGAMGLPVFANGGAGLPYMMGPTGGFLLGFLGMAYFAGLAADRGLTKGVVSTAIVALVLSAALYIPGLIWPAAFMDKSAVALISGWMAPFLVGDAVKAVIAALVVTGAWAMAKRKV